MSARCRFLLVWALVAAVAAAGACSTTPSPGPSIHSSTVRPTTEASTADLDSTMRCGQPLDVDDLVGALAAAVDEFSATIDSDRTATGCAVVAHPLCAALFLIGATDPIAAFGAGLSIDDVDRLAELHHRVLVDGAEAARRHGDDELEDAFRAMIGLDVRAAVGGDDQMAAIAVARSDSAIVGPIASAESRCGRG